MQKNGKSRASGGRMKLTFSAIIVGFKRKDYIFRAVSSVLSQDYPKDLVEIIVVKAFKDDDLDYFLENNKVISLFSDTLSNGESLSKGIRSSSKEVICLLDDDDIFAPNKFDEISKLLEDESHHADMIINGYYRMDEDENSISHGSFKKKSHTMNCELNNIVLRREDLDSKIWETREIYFNTSRISLRRKNAHGLCDFLETIPYTCDTAITLYHIVMNLEIGYTDSILTGYRVNQKSISQYKNFSNDLRTLGKIIEKEIKSYAKILSFVNDNEQSLRERLIILLSFLNLRLAYAYGGRIQICKKTINTLKQVIRYKNKRTYGLYPKLNLYIYRDFIFLPFILLLPKTFCKFRLTSFY